MKYQLHATAVALHVFLTVLVCHLFWRTEKEAEAAAAAAAADTVIAATSAAPAGAGTLRSAAVDAAPKTGRSGERGRGGRKKYVCI